MPAYIVQSADTCYIYGDTRDIGEQHREFASIVDPCRAIDEASDQGEGHDYFEVLRLTRDEVYVVFGVDANGSVPSPVVRSGRNEETVRALMRHCKVVGKRHWQYLHNMRQRRCENVVDEVRSFQVAQKMGT